MKSYIWFHPKYIAKEDRDVWEGQQENAVRTGYVALGEHELHKVKASDHLTVVGHSTPPKSSDKEDEEDTGHFIQGETASKFLRRLTYSGLSVPPKILSLECCQAGIADGLAYKLSKTPFMRNTIIEACTGGIGRETKHTKFSGFTFDVFQRVIKAKETRPWKFYLAGKRVAAFAHASYALEDAIRSIVSRDFHFQFFRVYNPGIFGGRVGRYCDKNSCRISLEQAKRFAKEKPGSATAIALKDLESEGLLTLKTR